MKISYVKYNVMLCYKGYNQHMKGYTYM